MFQCACDCVCVCACACACMCLCVQYRERQRSLFTLTTSDTTYIHTSNTLHKHHYLRAPSPSISSLNNPAGIGCCFFTSQFWIRAGHAQKYYPVYTRTVCTYVFMYSMYIHTYIHTVHAHAHARTHTHTHTHTHTDASSGTYIHTMLNCVTLPSLSPTASCLPLGLHDTAQTQNVTQLCICKYIYSVYTLYHYT